MTSKLQEHAPASHCRDCGAAVDYHYCCVCGQETRLHVPSAGEFIHEFVGHYVALEGRLWKTLALLLFKPGFLTWEYLQGRRARYVQPLRVYLTFSILFFAVLKLGPPLMDTGSGSHGSAPAPVAAQAEPKPQLQSGAPQVSEPVASGRQSKEQELANATLEYFPQMAQRIDAFQRKSQAEQTVILTSAFYAYVPYAIFCLMPLFAGLLKLLYLGSGRHYGEHLLFALHTNAFAFAMLATLIMLKRGGIGGLVTFVLILWLAFYLPIAMRRVYGGSRLVTGLRWIVLAVLHVLSLLLAVVFAFGWAVMH